MNWHGELDYFYPLGVDEERLFAPARETALAIQSYNQVLQQVIDGERDQAIEKLAQISSDFPMFAEARHLYGILLAGRGDYKKALEILKQARLLDLEPTIMERLKLEIRELEREVKAMNLQAARQRRREELLMPVKRDLAKGSILQKAGDQVSDVSMASAKEREQLMRREQGETGRRIELYAEDEAAEKQKTRRFLVVTLALAVIIYILFMAFIRPLILNKRETVASDRLRWLEERLDQERDNPAFQELLDEYDNYVAGDGNAEE